MPKSEVLLYSRSKFNATVIYIIIPKCAFVCACVCVSVCLFVQVLFENG